MASTLDRTGESRPDVERGRRTRDLGPSDSSDTGSDVVGGPGFDNLEQLDLDRGTTSDPDRAGQTAGPDIGDSDLDSDSDAAGTGENIGAGRDPARTAQDIEPDRVTTDPDQPDLDTSDEDATARDEPPVAPGVDAAGEGTGLRTDRGGGSSASPDAAPPTIDQPPPVEGGNELPVADRGTGTSPQVSPNPNQV